jgi:hypothetical protein
MERARRGKKLKYITCCPSSGSHSATSRMAKKYRLSFVIMVSVATVAIVALAGAVGCVGTALSRTFLLHAGIIGESIHYSEFREYNIHSSRLNVRAFKLSLSKKLQKKSALRKNDSGSQEDSSGIRRSEEPEKQEYEGERKETYEEIEDHGGGDHTKVLVRVEFEGGGPGEDWPGSGLIKDSFTNLERISISIFM